MEFTKETPVQTPKMVSYKKTWRHQETAQDGERVIIIIAFDMVVHPL